MNDALKTMHDHLVQAHQALETAIKDFLGAAADVRTDTAFALGELTGKLGKARALVGRDVDGEAHAAAGPGDAGDRGGAPEGTGGA